MLAKLRRVKGTSLLFKMSHKWVGGRGVPSTKYLEIWGWEFSWTQIFIAVKGLQHISSVAKLGHLVGSYIAPLVM
jgi:hypothetical protein